MKGVVVALSLILLLTLISGCTPEEQNTGALMEVSPVEEQEAPSISAPNESHESQVKPANTQSVKVAQVIDGDTIKIEGGERVRYIGIDTPETVHPDEPIECYGKEASAKNKDLVDGQTVDLEKDVSERDKYGRLLRYVWVGDQLVNEYLVREGFAHSSTYPPDVKYQSRFLEAERLAREEGKGLWGNFCDTWQEPTPTKAPTPTMATSGNTQPGVGGNNTCDCSKTCGKMTSCEEAYFQLNNCGCTVRDGDNDGVPCESICL